MSWITTVVMTVVKVMAEMKRRMTRVITTMIVRSVLALVEMVCTTMVALTTVVVSGLCCNKRLKHCYSLRFFTLDIRTSFFDSYLSRLCPESTASGCHQQRYYKPLNRPGNLVLYNSHSDGFDCSRPTKQCASSMCSNPSGINSGKPTSGKFPLGAQLPFWRVLATLAIALMSYKHD